MNSPQRQQKARGIFMELVDLTDAERRAALARACGDDATLRAEVEELFRADREAKGFLSPAPGSLASGSLASGSLAISDPGEQAGAQIGRYKLLNDASSPHAR